MTHEPRPERKVKSLEEASRRTLRSPSRRLCPGRKRLQFASVSGPCFGVALRKPSIRPPAPRSATDAVPRSVLSRLHPGGYGSAPPRLRATFQLVGGEAGRSQANGPVAGRWPAWPPPARLTTSTRAARVTPNTPAAAPVRLVISDAAIPVVRAAVVVGVAVTATALWDGIGLRLGLRLRRRFGSRLRRGGSRRRR